MKRSSMLASGTIAGLIVGSVLMVTPAMAATLTTGNGSALLSFAANCLGANTAVLTADITLDSVISVACDLTIDLSGNALTTPGVDIAASHTLTIDDTAGGGSLLADATGAVLRPGIHVRASSTLIVDNGTVDALGGADGAGIGGAGIGSGSLDGSVGSVTINGGTVTATGGVYTAGIGGAQYFAGGSVTINGGVVVANGTIYAAGIGGGESGAGGTVSITGGSVTATGFTGGAGIGGGKHGAGATVAISGGTVVADSEGNGSGIGGGGNDPGDNGSQANSAGSLTVTGGDVTASCTTGCAAIGGGRGASGGAVSITGATVHAKSDFTAVGAGENGVAFGSLDLSSTLEVDGLLTIPDSSAGPEVVIQSGGVLLGAGSDPRAGAAIIGTGQIDNHGVIALDASHVMATIGVNDHNYDVTFDAQDGSTPTLVHLFAADFASGFRPFPTPPAGDEWNTAMDGSGSWFTDHSVVSGDVTLYAAKAPIHTAALLANAVATCDTPVVLVADIALTDRLAIGCDLTLDLNGKTLTGPGIDVTSTHGLTLADSSGTDAGTLDLHTTPAGKAAISVPAGAALTIRGGTIFVIGGSGAAGIGGDLGLSAGVVTVQAGQVSATGGEIGAGIGGGSGGAGGTTTISGGVVRAQGGLFAAGIGGGDQGAGGSTTIGVGAIVLASGSQSAVGTGREASGPLPFGTLTVAGDLEVSGPLEIPGSPAVTEVTIASTGLLAANDADPTGGVVATPNVTGSGQILNHGVIALDASHFASTLTVSDHNYLVTFNRQDGSTPTGIRLYAPRFSTGFRTVPTGTWNTAANGSGSAFTATTPVSASLTVYAPPPDADGDGVPNATDRCAGSDLSAGSATRPKAIAPNNYWLTTSRTITNGKATYTLAQTGGCTVADIIMKLNLGKGQIKYGLAPGSLTTWLATLH